MDYKKLIERIEDSCELATAIEEDNLFTTLEDAATAIETLLAERDAAAKYVPRSCQNCKWWDVDEGCIAAADMGGCFELRELWQWRGPQKGG